MVPRMPLRTNFGWQNRMRKFRIKIVVLWTSVLSAGCSCSRFPPPPERPKLNPAEAAARAMADYDSNHDGKIDAQEFE